MTRRELRIAGLPEPISHYTDAVIAGDLLFISGVVPVDAAGAAGRARRRRQPRPSRSSRSSAGC